MPAPNPYAPPAADLAPPAPSADPGALASRESRLGASLLDLALVLAASVAMVGIIALSGDLSREPVGDGSVNPLEFASSIGLGFLPLAALLLFQAYRLSTTGQSLGKKWVGIRVVRLDGGPVNFVNAVLLRSMIPGVFGWFPLFGGLFSLVDVLFIFREDRRCLHDLMATTKVVRA